MTYPQRMGTGTLRVPAAHHIFSVLRVAVLPIAVLPIAVFLVVSLSLSLSPVSSRKASEWGWFHCCTAKSCKNSGSDSNRSTSATSVGSGSGRSHGASYVCKYYEVLHVRYYVGAPVLSHWHRGAVALLRQDRHDLEVGYVVFIVNACAGAQSLWSVYEGMSPISS
jgi:hypothetical protein